MFENHFVSHYNPAGFERAFEKAGLNTETSFNAPISGQRKPYISNLTKLSEAIQNRNVNEIKEILKKEGNAEDRIKLVNHIDHDNKLSFLHVACRANFEEAVGILLENQANLEVVDEEGRQPIHYAAKFFRSKRQYKDFTSSRDPASINSTKDHLNESCLGLLINHNADVNARDFFQSTPLHYACAKGHVDAVKMCLEYPNVKIKVLDDHQSSLLHEAAKNGHFKVVSLLLSCCEKQNMNLLEQKDISGFTPLLYSCKNGHLKIVEAILKSSEQFGSKGLLNQMLEQDFQGNNPLHAAAEGEYVETVQFLLETWKKASKKCGTNMIKNDLNYVNHIRTDGSTTLHLAAAQGDLDVLKLLLDEDPLIDGVNKKNETAVFLATAKKHLSCVQMLLQKGCNIEIRNFRQMTPFLKSCENNSFHITKVLLDNGSDITATDALSRNCFLVAAENGNDQTLQLLFDQLTDSKELMMEGNHLGNTGLHDASAHGYLSTVKMLVEKGIPLSVSNDCEGTAIHAAAATNRDHVVSYIATKEPARLNDVDDYSRTPLYFASMRGNIETLKVLLELGAKTEILDTRQWSVLHVCAWKGLYECAEALIKSNPSLVHKGTNNKEIPLHLACSSGHQNLARLLLSWKSDVSARQSDGRNALDVAIDNNHESCVRLLLEDDTWKLSLQNITEEPDKEFILTPLRKMIKTMPELVEIVLTKSISNNGLEPNDKNFEVIFNYEFIEDMYRFSEWNGGNEISMAEKPGIFRSLLKNIFTKQNSYDFTTPNISVSDTEAVCSSFNQDEFENTENEEKKLPLQSYFSSSVLYRSHPLKLMADTKREGLLLHPIVTSLLLMKWRKYGQKLFILNLLAYILYLTFLNYYVLSTPPRYAVNETSTSSFAEEGVGCVSIIEDEQEVWGTGCQNYTGIRIVAVNLVIVFSAIQLFKEMIQLFHLRFSYLLEYTNYLELILYSLSIVVFYNSDPFVNLTGLRTNLQWQLLSIVILLAWCNLLLYLRLSPLGLYIIMIENVGKSFALFGLIVLFFLIGFSGSFYVLLQNQFVFVNPVLTWIKTLVMMTGEYDYQTIFLEHFTSEAYQDKLIYETTTYLIFVIFVLFMSLVISNLLVGIAVDDIAAVRNQATLKRLALRVDSVLNLEYAFPAFIHRRMVTLEQKIKPNKIKRNYFLELILSEEHVNIDYYINKLKQKQSNQRDKKKESNYENAFESLQSTLKDISQMQRKLEKEMTEMKTEIKSLKDTKYKLNC